MFLSCIYLRPAGFYLGFFRFCLITGCTLNTAAGVFLNSSLWIRQQCVLAVNQVHIHTLHFATDVIVDGCTLCFLCF